MAQTRKSRKNTPAKKKATKTPAKKKAPDGRGRPKKLGEAMSKTVAIRLNGDQFDHLTAYIVDLNERRQAAGLGEIQLSTWLREVALKSTGGSSLGLSGQLSKKAEAATRRAEEAARKRAAKFAEEAARTSDLL